MTDEAQRALGLLNSIPGAVLRRVDTYDGPVAQIYHLGEGLLIVPVAIIDELLEAGAVEKTDQPHIHVIVRDGQTVEVPPDAQTFDTTGAIVPAQEVEAPIIVKAKAKK